MLPWLLTTVTVPHLGQVYEASSPRTLFSIAGFGACWGVGATLTGIGLSMLGIGLGMAIILGLCASVGSLIPLLILTPQQLHTPQGYTYLLGTAIMLIGIAVSARAGVLRDAARNQAREAAARTSFRAGFIVCCLSGLLSSTLNFSYAFGGEAVKHALELGTSSLWATGVVTALAVSGGFIANFLYCGYLLRKNHTAHKFAGSGAKVGWLCGGLMGLFWFGGQALYGLGISHMGKSGRCHRMAAANGHDHHHQQRGRSHHRGVGRCFGRKQALPGGRYGDHFGGIGSACRRPENLLTMVRFIFVGSDL